MEWLKDLCSFGQSFEDSGFEFVETIHFDDFNALLYRSSCLARLILSNGLVLLGTMFSSRAVPVPLRPSSAI